MKRICIAMALLLALAACKEERSNNNPYREPVGKPGVMADNSDDPGITMVGPRLGFDGKVRLGCCSLGIGL